MSRIGERIKQIRNKLSLTQGKFAERVGMSASYIAELENGTYEPNDRAIRLISTEYAVDEHWLRTGEGEMTYGAAEANIAQLNSLFRSMSPAFQECALTQLGALSETYKRTMQA